MVSKEKVLVQFENVKETYFIDDDKPAKIEYVLNSEYDPSTKDWLGIFPKGWRGLEQQLLGEHAIARSSKDNKQKRVIEFNLSFLLNGGKMNFFNAHYQIVYVSKNMQVLGRSSYFRLQRKYGDVLSHGDNAGVFEGSGIAQISASVPPCPTMKCIKPCVPAKSIVRTVNCGGVGFPLVKPYRSESILPYYARDYISHCRYCSNVMQQNHSLLKQVKELAQINRQLNQSLANLEQKFELSMVAQKRLKLWCYCLRQEKHAYEGFVGELLKCLQGNFPVCLRDSVKGSEMLVQRVSTDLNNHILPHQMRHTSSVSDRYLKAIIGSQEMKIQELSAKLNELGKKLSQFEMNSQPRNNEMKSLTLMVNKHSEYEEYKNDKNTHINEIDGCDKNGIVNDEEIKLPENEIVKKNGFNNKSPEEIHAIIEVCRANEKLEAVFCDMNNNCDFSDNDSDNDKEDDDIGGDKSDEPDYGTRPDNQKNDDDACSVIVGYQSDCDETAIAANDNDVDSCERNCDGIS